MKKSLFNNALRILLFTNGIVLIAGAMLGPIYALFVEQIGGDLLDASLTGGIFALAAGLTTLIAGRYADKAKRDDLIVAGGYLIMGVGFLLMNFVNSIWFLFGVQALIGFAEAFYSPAFDALYSQHLTKNKAGRQWGAWESLNYFSIAIGAVFGGFVASKFGFNAIFITMAILCFVSAAYIWVLPKKLLN
ncbi:MFS transporter [Candidatus Woesearchaeota archaeon]|jgi:MFS family permease|nr:MFS transporter [Candidatus Woesearchaeota archaeon]MBT6520130.1 MFS transporter [Candidatus Woesearchaeota archaeon]MBT7366735.1 MFS transporter [Candidatus Woesearchaeota archaeon]